MSNLITFEPVSRNSLFDEQVLFYHTDPLEVARRIVKPDLVLSKDHIAEYRKILVRKSLAT
jgi:hypothetical protein